MSDISEQLPTDGVSESENPAVDEGLAGMAINDDTETNTTEGAQGGEAAGGSSDSHISKLTPGWRKDDREEEKELNKDPWPKSTLKAQLKKLRTCQIRKGSTYIYRLWKELLHYWFTDCSRRVYMATPFLDVERLEDVCRMFLDPQNNANLCNFYVRRDCYKKETVEQVKKGTLLRFESNEKTVIKEKIFPQISVPERIWHAKFIACIKGKRAEVLVTSANFTDHHFSCENLETVQYLTMKDDEFFKNFLKYFK